MSAPNDGGPAFPVLTPAWNHQDSPQQEPRSEGMSLRAYYAGQALAGVIAAENNDGGVFETDEKRAAYCVQQADALIAELAKEKP